MSNLAITSSTDWGAGRSVRISKYVNTLITAVVLLALGIAAVYVGSPFVRDITDGTVVGDDINNDMIRDGLSILNGHLPYSGGTNGYAAESYVFLFQLMLAILFGFLPPLLAHTALSAATFVLLAVVIAWQGARNQPRGWLFTLSFAVGILLFVALQPTFGGHYQVGRPHALMTTFGILSLGLFEDWRRSGSQSILVSSAVLSCLSAFTLQSGFVFPLSIGLYLLATDRRAMVVFGFSVAAIALGVVALMQYLTAGQFLFWTVIVPGKLPNLWEWALPNFKKMTLLLLVASLPLLITSVLVTGKIRAILRDPVSMTLVMSMIAAVLASANVGGGHQAYKIPVCLWLILFLRYHEWTRVTLNIGLLIAVMWLLVGAHQQGLYYHRRDIHLSEIRQRGVDYAIAKKILRNVDGPIWGNFHTGLINSLGKADVGPAHALILYPIVRGVYYPPIIEDLENRVPHLILLTKLSERYFIDYGKTVIDSFSLDIPYDNDKIKGVLKRNYVREEMGNIVTYRVATE